MKKKGFTLIELLAVIIILAVIALIATPIILNVVDNAKESARQSSISGYADATRLAVTEYQFGHSGETPKLDQAFIDTIKPQGSTVTCEEVIYSNDYGVVLNKCNVVPDTKEYCFASGKTFSDCNDASFQDIFNKANNGNGDVVLTGDKIGEKVLEQFPNLALGTTPEKGCATSNNNYSYMGGCYLKEAQTTNYIWFSGFLYRIMGINANGSVRLITEENVTAISYNVSGNINFIGSHAESWLNEYFISNLKGTDKIVESKFCQGTVSSTSNLQRTDCTGGTEISKKVGLLSIDEYNLASAGISYLKNGQRFWTMSPYDARSAWDVDSSGGAGSGDMTNPTGVRAVINVNSSTVITEGDGTLSDNYILNEDKTIAVTGNLNEKATSGEYVKLGNKVYRVVGKNNDGTTKLILDSYYQETAGTNYKMSYGSNNTFTTASGIGQKLNTSVLEWLVPDAATKSKIKPDSKWYQNPFNYGNKYTEANKDNATPITATVGLIHIGEMLSGQSASILTKNYTVNSSYSNVTYYWALTPHTNALSAWRVDEIGNASGNSVSLTYGVRAVININSDVTITSGNGTLSSPYEI